MSVDFDVREHEMNFNDGFVYYKHADFHFTGH